ncbi:hypothetical protein [Streptomyces sp. NPDC127108]|uniref:hypothetical protein n=1 Tax=Streptomyces sp. NPDC127108 TaxID=3345361 RepID=UPI0036406E34
MRRFTLTVGSLVTAGAPTLAVPGSAHAVHALPDCLGPPVAVVPSGQKLDSPTGVSVYIP